MSTQFHALRLSNKINEKVLNMASRHGVDLNSVRCWTDKMIIVGEERTGLIIHVREHGSINIPCHELESGVYVTFFVDGMTSEHYDLTGETL